MEAPQRPGLLGVWIINVAAQVITIADLEYGLRILSFIVAIGYTLYKWYKDLKSKK
jgi:hypothetical protein